MQNVYINLSNKSLNSLHPILKNFYKSLENYYDVKYINGKKESGKEVPKLQKNSGLSKFIFTLKKVANIIIPRLNIIKGEYDGPILTANNFLITDNAYYIITSSLIQFSGLKVKPLYNKVFKFLFKYLLARKNLKKIFFYSNTAKEEFEKYCNDVLKIKNKELFNKFEVIYPFLKDNYIITEGEIINRINSRKKIKFLFIARNFLGKGGLELIEALKIIKNKDKDLLKKIKITIISDIPTKYKDILLNLRKEGVDLDLFGIDFTQEELEDKFYKTHHVLLHLTRADLFGMVSLESKKNGLAVITTKQYLNYPELFTDNEALFVDIKRKYLWNDGLPKISYIDIWNKEEIILNVDEIVKNIVLLVKNTNKLKEYAINNLNSLEMFQNRIDLGNLFTS